MPSSKLGMTKLSCRTAYEVTQHELLRSTRRADLWECSLAGLHHISQALLRYTLGGQVQTSHVVALETARQQSGLRLYSLGGPRFWHHRCTCYRMPHIAWLSWLPHGLNKAHVTARYILNASILVPRICFLKQTFPLLSSPITSIE